MAGNVVEIINWHFLLLYKWTLHVCARTLKMRRNCPWHGCLLMKYWICNVRNNCCGNTTRSSRRRPCRNVVLCFTVTRYRTTFSDHSFYIRLLLLLISILITYGMFTILLLDTIVVTALQLYHPVLCKLTTTCSVTAQYVHKGWLHSSIIW